MKNVLIDNVMKTADIEESKLSPSTLSYFQDNCTPAYTDNEGLNEHLYSIEDLMGDYEGFDETVKNELIQLAAELNAQECAYIRLTKW